MWSSADVAQDPQEEDLKNILFQGENQEQLRKPIKSIADKWLLVPAFLKVRHGAIVVLVGKPTL
jgi:hypothetical protein